LSLPAEYNQEDTKLYVYMIKHSTAWVTTYAI